MANVFAPMLIIVPALLLAPAAQATTVLFDFDNSTTRTGIFAYQTTVDGIGLTITRVRGTFDTVNSGLPGFGSESIAATSTGTLDNIYYNIEFSQAFRSFSIQFASDSPGADRYDISLFTGANHTGTMTVSAGGSVPAGSTNVTTAALSQFANAPDSLLFRSGTLYFANPDRGSRLYIDNITLSTDVPGTLPPTPAVPEPATWAMMAIGFGAIGAALRRTRKAKPALA